MIIFILIFIRKSDFFLFTDTGFTFLCVVIFLLSLMTFVINNHPFHIISFIDKNRQSGYTQVV